VVSTLNRFTSYAASTSTNQTLDTYGNLIQSQVYDYAGSPTGTRTYNFAYTTTLAWYYQFYLPLYIFNRQTSATVTPAGGRPLTLQSTSYDNLGGASNNATNNHDPKYDTSFVYRGNPSVVSGLNASDPVSTWYDTAGVPYQTSDANGHSVSLQTDSTTNYSLPAAIQPNGNSSLQTSATYASSWSAASMTGPNGDTGTTTYDSYGRPATTTIPDGAVTSYSYTYNWGASTQTATVNGRWKTTTLDGFGRTVRVQNGNGSTVVSTVDTTVRALRLLAVGQDVGGVDALCPRRHSRVDHLHLRWVRAHTDRDRA